MSAGAPMECVGMDIPCPFPVSAHGNHFVLVAMDYFTKWLQAYALPNLEASTIEGLFAWFRIPQELH